MAVQIVDARNPLMYYTEDLMKYASELEVQQHSLDASPTPLINFLVALNDNPAVSSSLNCSALPSLPLSASKTRDAPREQSGSAHRVSEKSLGETL